jgi:hypothetical protein
LDCISASTSGKWVKIRNSFFSFICILLSFIDIIERLKLILSNIVTTGVWSLSLLLHVLKWTSQDFLSAIWQWLIFAWDCTSDSWP